MSFTQTVETFNDMLSQLRQMFPIRTMIVSIDVYEEMIEQAAIKKLRTDFE